MDSLNISILNLSLTISEITNKLNKNLNSYDKYINNLKKLQLEESISDIEVKPSLNFLIKLEKYYQTKEDKEFIPIIIKELYTKIKEYRYLEKSYNYLSLMRDFEVNDLEILQFGQLDIMETLNLEHDNEGVENYTSTIIEKIKKYQDKIVFLEKEIIKLNNIKKHEILSNNEVEKDDKINNAEVEFIETILTNKKVKKNYSVDKDKKIYDAEEEVIEPIFTNEVKIDIYNFNIKQRKTFQYYQNKNTFKRIKELLHNEKGCRYISQQLMKEGHKNTKGGNISHVLVRYLIKQYKLNVF